MAALPTGTAGNDALVFRSAGALRAAGAAGLDGGGGVDTLYLQFDAALGDADFAGLRNVEAIYLAATGQQSLTFATEVGEAFGRSLYVYGQRAGGLDVDGSALAGTALGIYAAASGASHLRCGAANDAFTFGTAAGFAAAGRTVDGGAGSDTLTLTFAASLADADFAGISHVESLQLGGAGVQHVSLGAVARAAFGSSLTLYANRSGGLDLDASGYGGGATLVVYGSAQADTVHGGAERDILFGGAGADLFVLDGRGGDTVADFTRGQDRLDLSGSGFGTFNEVMAASAQVGADTVIRLGSGSVTLRGVAKASLTAGDFILNRMPTDVTLSTSKLAENAAAGTVVGTLSGTDPDQGDSLAYAVLGRDAADFAVVDGRLVTTRAFDFETEPTRSITLRATDRGGLSVEKAVTVEVTNVNEAPTALDLHPNGYLFSNQGAGTLAGSLAVSDPDEADWYLARGSYTYRLTGADAGHFVLDAWGNLFLADRIGWKGGAARHVTVEVSDAGGLSYSKSFSISALSASPTDISVVASAMTDGTRAGTAVASLSAAGVDPTDHATFSIVGGRDAAFFAVSGDQLVTKVEVDYAAGATRELLIRAATSSGLYHDELLTLAVHPSAGGGPGHGPLTAIGIDDPWIAEGLPAGALVGTMRTTGGIGGVQWSIVGGQDAAKFDIDAAGHLTLREVGLYYLDPLLDVVVRGNDATGAAVTRELTVGLLPVRYVSGGGIIEGTPGSDCWMPDGDAVINMVGFDEAQSDQIGMYLLFDQSVLGRNPAAPVRLAGDNDLHVEVQAALWGDGNWTTIATVENAISSDGILDGDRVADSLTQAELDQLSHRWLESFVIHA